MSQVHTNDSSGRHQQKTQAVIGSLAIIYTKLPFRMNTPYIVKFHYG